MNPKVDEFFARGKRWHDEFNNLRRIVLDCQLTEELKWGQPCYSLDGKNVLIIHGFKAYCAILFIKGALMKDAKGLLIRQTENVQASRQIRFTNSQEIQAMEKTLKAYIQEAIRIERAGLKVEMKRTSDFVMAEEFRKELDENAALKSAFDALSPGRQRAYLYYFSQPKQSKTREARVDKCLPRILDGMGLDD